MLVPQRCVHWARQPVPEGCSQEPVPRYAIRCRSHHQNRPDGTFYGLNSDQANGEQFISFGGPVHVSTIEFCASGTDLDLEDDFSVVGFQRHEAVADLGSTRAQLGLCLLSLHGRG